jgi:TPP-dependent pyruvate/acetoin dehydrogenase alpha subunit
VPVPYRDQAVVDTWFDTVDPITLFIERLRRWELADPAVIDEVRRAVERDVEQAVTFAKDSPYPPPEAAYADLYAETAEEAA